MLGVSKTILREAMKSLEAVGILTISGGNGIFVSELDYERLVGHISYAVLGCPEDFDNLVRMRLMIEVAALEYILENADEDDMTRLKRLCDREAHAETPEEYLASDMEFHKELVACAKNHSSSNYARFSTFSSPI